MERTEYYLSVADRLPELPLFGKISDEQPYAAFGNNVFHIELRKDVGKIVFEIRFDFEARNQQENIRYANITKEAFENKNIFLPFGVTSSKTWCRLIYRTDQTLGYIPNAEKTAEIIKTAYDLLPPDVLTWAHL